MKWAVIKLSVHCRMLQNNGSTTKVPSYQSFEAKSERNKMIDWLNIFCLMSRLAQRIFHFWVNIIGSEGDSKLELYLKLHPCCDTGPRVFRSHINIRNDMAMISHSRSVCKHVYLCIFFLIFHTHQAKPSIDNFHISEFKCTVCQIMN